jgi:carbamoyltransferase
MEARMACWLGISEDLFDAGVALCDGDRVVFAANEERYSRRKNEGGFPHRSLQALFDYTGVAPEAIDRICVAGHMTPPLPVRMIPRAHDWIFNARRQNKDSQLRRFFDDVTFFLPITHTTEGSLLRRLCVPWLAPVTRRTLPPALRNKPLTFVDHHLAHAAGAWYGSGLDSALCFTSDGMGDGLSMTVSRCDANGIERLWTASSRDSLGLFFQVLAEAFGFLSCRDEGKITGLAAGGDPARVPEPSPFTFDDDRLRYHGRLGQRGIDWARARLTSKYSREDVAAWAQEILERHVVEIARHWLGRTGLRNIVVSGGVVANVKLNQRLHEIDGVDRVFVFPNMGDGGLGLGAIWAEQRPAPGPMADVFLGEDFPETALLAAIEAAGLHAQRPEAPEDRVAELLANGKIVCRFQGRMEYGPRALGNRSILAATTDKAVVQRLNDALRRSDFMPFAPAILDEEADEYVVNADAARHAAEFMTVCFDCTERMRREHPAVVHLDGTARAQFVRADRNPGFHRVLREFGRRTGGAVLLNTSFNIHEEPIVRTPQEAVTAFVTAGLDYLSIGPFLVAGHDEAARSAG